MTQAEMELFQEIETLTEKDKELLLNVIRMKKKGIRIVGFYGLRPIVEESELSRLNLEPYFDDGLTK